jgi:hypothetical protein
MKTCILFFLVFVIYSMSIFGQEKSKRLNFILLIDNEVPVATVYNGVFIITDSSRILKDTLSFDYEVGSIKMSSSNYNKLFFRNPQTKIEIKFKYESYQSHFTDVYEYKTEIPSEWINEMYIILKVYNYFNKESRRKYFLKKGGYGIEIRVPGAGSVIPLRK